jgi:hypothetical protein
VEHQKGFTGFELVLLQNAATGLPSRNSFPTSPHS